MHVVSRHLSRSVMQGSKAARIAGQPYARVHSAHSPSPERLQLSRLPVPKLEDTMARYVKSLEPFMLEDAAREGVPFEVAQARYRELAKTFLEGSGKERQAQLHDLDQRSPNNWLDDNFWMKKMYLEWRAPLLVHSDWWLALQNDSTIPEITFDMSKPVITPWQVRRAAWMLHRLLDFKARLESEDLYPQTTRTGIWLRNTALKSFTMCRSPRTGCDDMLQIPSLSLDEPQKVLVMVYDWFYIIDVYHSAPPSTVPDHSNLMPLVDDVGVLEERLRAVVVDAQGRRQRGERAVPVGVLSADNRDVWAKNLDYLLKLSPTNKSVLRAVQHSIVAVSLDDWMYPHLPSRDDAPHPPVFASGTPPNDIDAHLHNTRSSHAARNRWFDKAFTLILESTARAGVMGEHSPVDALVPSMAGEYAVIEPVNSAAFASPEPAPFANVLAASLSPGGWSRLDWVVDGHIRRECMLAEERARKVIEDSDDSVLWFTDYGSDWIKSLRLSADAYVQMALQLAWYREQKYFTATYETALTRLFRNGRTETIRTFSTESRAFVLGMMDASSPVDGKAQLLRRAVASHEKLTRGAATGKGVDRHLFGLSLMSSTDSELFTDPLYAKSQEWKMSTSGLSAGHLFQGTGFGTPYPDGYGINYLAGPDMIKFGVESKHSCPSTSTSSFLLHITHALHDMRALFLPSSTEDAHAPPFPSAHL